MAQYLLSTYMTGGDEHHEPMTEEQMQQSWAQISALEEDMKSEGAWVFSARLHEPDTATVVRSTSGDVVTTDGPFVESKEHLAGFYIVEAPDLDGALAWAARTSEIIGAPIEVWPFAATAS